MKNIKIVFISALSILVLLLVLFLITIKIDKDRIHCSGQLNSIFGDDQTIPKFSGIYTFILDGSRGYISVNGLFKDEVNTYAVQRLSEVRVSHIEEDFYEIREISSQSLTGDNIPEPMYVRYIHNPISVVRVDKTLNNSFLIGNLYSPILICLKMD